MPAVSAVGIDDCLEMRIGILELQEDPFVQDVLSRLCGAEVEFLSFRGQFLPFQRRYRVILDRLSYCSVTLREMMKGLSLEGTYIINNPFAATNTNKMMELVVSEHLGIPYPQTFVLPGRTPRQECEEVIPQPDWDYIIAGVGFPCIVKPFDGFAWTDVWVVNTEEELKQAYAVMESHDVLLVQRKVAYQEYYRVFCINKKEVLPIRWTPRPLGAGEYIYSEGNGGPVLPAQLVADTIRLNTALDLDINAVEWCIDGEGRPWLIDAFNEVPDIVREQMPPSYYEWVVDRFAACIEDKLDSGARNHTPLMCGDGDVMRVLAALYPSPARRP